MDVFANVLDIIQQVVTMLKDFFESILATLKGEEAPAEDGAEA